ncbi:MAG: hypothetical protein ACRC68_09900, partial [Clostridium sp.]
KNNAIELVLNEGSAKKKGESKLLVELPKEVLAKFSSNIKEKLKSTDTNTNIGYRSIFKNPAISTVSQILLGASPILLFFLLSL